MHLIINNQLRNRNHTFQQYSQNINKSRKLFQVNDSNNEKNQIIITSK